MGLALALASVAACAGSEAADRREALDAIAWSADPPPQEARCRTSEHDHGIFDGAAGTGVPDTLLISDAPRLPCRLLVVPTITVGPSPNAAYPDPGFGRIVRHRRGLLTPVLWHMGRQRAALLLWDSTGSYVETIGGPGDGPGEFGTSSIPAAYNGPRDRLYVNEHRRWTVLDSSLQFVRTINAPRIGREDDALVVTGEGGYVYAGRVPGLDPTTWFHHSDSLGNLTASFGPLGGYELHSSRGRPLARATDSTFWAAPPPGAPDGYALEEWTTDGRLLRVVKRDPHWMHQQVFPGRCCGAMPRFRVNKDERGLLWVVAWVVRPGATIATLENPSDEERLELQRSIDLRLEVIDVDAGSLLASALVPAGELDGRFLEPMAWVSSRPETATYSVDADDLQHLHILEWHLVNR